MHVGIVVFDDVDYGLDLANALDEAQVCVTLYLSSRHVQAAVGGAEDVSSIHRLGLVPRRVGVRLVTMPRMRDPRSLARMWRLRNQVRADKVDVVHILMGPGEVWVAVLAWLLRGTPITSTLIIPEPDIRGSLPTWVIKAVTRLLTQGSDIVVVNGEAQVDLVRRLYKVPVERIRHVPLGARTTAALWAKGVEPEDPATVLFFGRAHHHKGLRYLVLAQPEVSERVPEAQFLIVAHGGELPECRELIADESRFEIHEGFVPGDEMPGYFQRASVVALPYLSASTSGILMTAYVFGKPVVASRVGAIPEYVEDGVTGILVPPADTTALADALTTLLLNPALRQQMGGNARAWLDRWQQTVVSGTLAAYTKAMVRHGISASAPAERTSPSIE